MWIRQQTLIFLPKFYYFFWRHLQSLSRKSTSLHLLQCLESKKPFSRSLVSSFCRRRPVPRRSWQELEYEWLGNRQWFLSGKKLFEVRKTKLNHTDVFHVSFSAKPPAKIPYLASRSKLIIYGVRLLVSLNYKTTLNNNTNITFKISGAARQICTVLSRPCNTWASTPLMAH